MASVYFLLLLLLQTLFQPTSSNFISTPAVLSPSPPHGPHTHAPAPAPPPACHPPLHPLERRFIAVQGVVYCGSCKYAGSDTLLDVSLYEAVVKLECNTECHPSSQVAKTDKNSYFYLEAPNTVTPFALHYCKAYLASSPLASCSKASLLHGGSTGAVLRPDKPFMAQKFPFVMYTVGPFAFEPQCPQ